jgi:hypothetical protein
MLPDYTTESYLVEDGRVELPTSPCKGDVLPLALIPRKWCGWWDSNPHCMASKTIASASCATSAIFGVQGWIRTTNSTILKVLRTSKGLEPFVQDASRLFTVSALTHCLAPEHVSSQSLRTCYTTRGLQLPCLTFCWLGVRRQQIGRPLSAHCRDQPACLHQLVCLFCRFPESSLKLGSDIVWWKR